MMSSKKLLHSIPDIDGSMDIRPAISLSCTRTSFNTVRRSNEVDTFLLEAAAYTSDDNNVVVEVETKLDDWGLLSLVC